MNNIIIIGTRPPCPRCGLLAKVVTEKIKELGISAEVTHLAYTDEAAKDFAQKMGLEAGTAKAVAQRISREIDFQKLAELEQNAENEGSEYEKYNDCGWSFAFDEVLRPFEKSAQEAGILMTPVLIINGEVKHQGSVPRLHEIEEWLGALKP